MRPVLADDGSAKSRASSKKSDVQKPMCFLTAVKLICPPPGARLRSEKAALVVRSEKGPSIPGRLPHLNIVLHVNSSRGGCMRQGRHGGPTSPDSPAFFFFV